MGVTLYCFVYGKVRYLLRLRLWYLSCDFLCEVPFATRNILELYENIKSKPVPYPEESVKLLLCLVSSFVLCVMTVFRREISQELRELFEHMLEKNPSKRITIPELKVIDISM